MNYISTIQNDHDDICGTPEETIWENPDYNIMTYEEQKRIKQKQNHWWIVKLPKQKGRFRPI